MEVGLSPRQIDDIVVVVRTFPIRVGGPSGPFDNETTWDDVAFRSGAPEVFSEYTSVTKRLRRVALFDLEGVKLACEYNRPTSLAVMGLDRIDFRNQGAIDYGVLTEQSKRFMDALETSTRVPISIAGTGFGTFDAIFLDRRAVETGTTKAESAYV
jgi:adenylosuccinate synthase